MKLKNPNAKPIMSSDYECRLVRPHPPTPEMVAAARPYRGDVIGAEKLIELAKRSAVLSKG